MSAPIPSDASGPGARSATAPPEGTTLSISAVERDTGISKETLRAWERRYGFPDPLRSTTGERLYPIDQVERLRLLRRLIDAGHRPGRIVRLNNATLERLSAEVLAPGRQAQEALANPSGNLLRYEGLLRTMQLETLRTELERAQRAQGLIAWIDGELIPLALHAQQATTAGRLGAHAERACLQLLMGIVQHQTSRMHRGPADAPRVVLATPPQETRRLQILASELVLTHAGCHCLQLGPQVPSWELVQACQAFQAQALVLYLGAGQSPTLLTEYVRAVRTDLGDDLDIWLSTRNPVLSRRPPGLARTVRLYGDLQVLVEQWRHSVRHDPLRPRPGVPVPGAGVELRGSDLEPLPPAIPRGDGGGGLRALVSHH